MSVGANVTCMGHRTKSYAHIFHSINCLFPYQPITQYLLVFHYHKLLVNSLFSHKTLQNCCFEGIQKK
ncbi:hypothetical protein XELAEV_18017651mg [Xenopus laevis]|uniref:Uncharacterized protein n=1 Tax=Xenopus laevis TaxID=8355 RepID=A0A974DE17_XENLA|nr:hypothetical protein XELAEV_18017651mg [Xenopus laevis]